MPINYLYIDDEQKEKVQHYVDTLQSVHGLRIERTHPIEFSLIVEKIIDSKYDGILIDWKLNDVKHDKVFYNAAEVAQALRSKSIENEEYAKPIILISTDDKLEASYELDVTAHDLFDHVYIKSFVIEKESGVGHELIRFAESYSKLKSSKKENLSVYQVLGLENEQTLDPRIKNNFLTKNKQLKPVHELARFIINDLLKIPGPLIDEDTVLARLGLSKENGKSWEGLKNKELNDIKYPGPFAEIWPRWWAKNLENWWDEKVDSKKPLQMLNAEQRVNHLNEKFSTDFKPADPIQADYSKEFWTVCQDLKMPLDSIDGFMIDSNKRFPWQEEQYICNKSVAERTYKDKNIKIHPLEEERETEFLFDDE